MKLSLISPIALLLLTACQSSGDTSGRITSKETEAASTPAPSVKLPPSPNFEKDHLPPKHADGSFSIYGLRKEGEEHLTQDVQVKGFIVEIYSCPCKKADKECQCLKPHFFLADRADETKDKALMVTDYPAKGRSAKLFTQGNQLTITGTFAKSSISGFSASEGLIIYKSAEVASPE